jgi:glycine cleavage system aminomethyltransferase T
MTRTGPSPANSAENITVAELLDLTAPPRADTTGFHLTNAGKDAYVLTIQGPESRWLTARVLEFIEALHMKTMEKAGD